MRKLLDKYRAQPTLKNAQKVRAYEREHSLSVCLLAIEDANLLADAIAHANRGK